jgi:CrcB protein
MNTGPDLRWDVLAVIALGGVLGSLARWSLTLLWHPAPGRFPWATFTANVSGCLLMGALMVVVLELAGPSRYLRPFLGVGVLGGYTTFSTFMLDARGLLAGGHPGPAAAYLLGSLAAGLAAVWLGARAARAVLR